jgi:cytochrome c peroxidase
MLKALSQFMVMMISSNSKYDKFRRNEVEGSIEEAAGYALSIKMRDLSCYRFNNRPFF